MARGVRGWLARSRVLRARVLLLGLLVASERSTGAPASSSSESLALLAQPEPVSSCCTVAAAVGKTRKWWEWLAPREGRAAFRGAQSWLLTLMTACEWRRNVAADWATSGAGD